MCVIAPSVNILRISTFVLVHNGCVCQLDIKENDDDDDDNLITIGLCLRTGVSYLMSLISSLCP